MPVADALGNHSATLVGATVSDDEIVSGEPGAIDHGAGGYLTTNAVTRRNYSPDPRHESGVDTNGTGWTLTQTTPAAEGIAAPPGAPSGITIEKIVLASGSVSNAAYENHALDSAGAWLYSCWVYVPVSWTGGEIVPSQNGFSDATLGDNITTNGVRGTWTRIARVMTANADLGGQIVYARVGGTPPVGVPIYIAMKQLRRASSLAELVPYFDGSGHVDENGNWVEDDQTGWLGTEHASASDYGPLGNGKTITLGGVAQRTDESDADTLIGGDASSNATQVKLASGSGNVLLIIGGTTYTFTAAWPSDAAPHFWVLVFDEANDTADLYIDGELFEAKTSVAAQHAAAQSLVIGAHGAGTDPFDGLSGFQFAAYGALDLSEAELEVLAAAAGVG